VFAEIPLLDIKLLRLPFAVCRQRDTFYQHDAENMSIHSVIRQHRQRLQLTEQQLADRCGVSRPAIQRWEKEGGTAPRRAIQARVAEVLGITLSELLGTDARTRPVEMAEVVQLLADQLAELSLQQRDHAASLLQSMARDPRGPWSGWLTEFLTTQKGARLHLA
jgi:transcriptional regulator with XRE-family HTH domain